MIGKGFSAHATGREGREHPGLVILAVTLAAIPAGAV
jgi:hypothetical protein